MTRRHNWHRELRATIQFLVGIGLTCWVVLTDRVLTGEMVLMFGSMMSLELIARGAEVLMRHTARNHEHEESP